MGAALLGLPLGTWWQLQQPQLWAPAHYVAIVLGALLLAALGVRGLRRHHSRAWLARVALQLALWAGLAAAGFGATGWRAAHFDAGRLPHHLQDRDIRVTGVVASLPRQRNGSTQFEFEVESARGAEGALTLPGKVALTWGEGTIGRAPGAASRAHASADPATQPALARPLPDRVLPGERWEFTVRLRQPHGLANPHGFDQELRHWQQGVQATGQVRPNGPGGSPRRLDEGRWAQPIDRARQAVRSAIYAQVPDARSAGVVVALVVGDQASIETGDWDIFRTTGVAHLISVSGLHVTMFATLAIWLVGLLWRGAARHWPALLLHCPLPVAAALGGIALAGLYATFSGGGVPAQRTLLMLAVVVGLRLLGRHWPWPMVWLLALNAVVLLDPWALLQAGFWLSFVAVGVLFASTLPGLLAQGAWGQFRALLRTQAVVTVALAPLTLMLFGQFSLVSLVANLVAIPWVTLLTLPLAMLGALWPPLWTLAGWAVQALVWWLGWLATWPWAALERPAVPWLLGVLAVLGGVWLVLRLPWHLRLWGGLLLWPVLVFAPARPPAGQFEVLAPDVGQGGAVLVRTAHHTLLYDAGPSYQSGGDAAQRVLLPLLRALGEHPDAVVVSHVDSDHSGGMAALARHWEGSHQPVEWLTSFAPQDVGLPELARLPAGRCQAGQRWDWDGVVFEVLHPTETDYQRNPPLSSNDLSCVLHITAASGYSALLTGDITLAMENRLALAQPGLRATLMMAPHHGSHSSSGPVWLNTLRPALIVVQAGHRNRFGHPAPRVIDRYEARQIPWVQTATCGAAQWFSAVPGEVSCWRDAQRRYWQYRAPPVARIIRSTAPPTTLPTTPPTTLPTAHPNTPGND
jgi:competence protein ComEC